MKVADIILEQLGGNKFVVKKNGEIENESSRHYT